MKSGRQDAVELLLAGLRGWKPVDQAMLELEYRTRVLWAARSRLDGEEDLRQGQVHERPWARAEVRHGKIHTRSRQAGRARTCRIGADTRATLCPRALRASISRGLFGKSHDLFASALGIPLAKRVAW